MNNDYKIYRVIGSEDNISMLDRANGFFNSQNQIPYDLKYMLKLCTKLTSKEKLIACHTENAEEVKSFGDITYFAVQSDRIICQFDHSYFPKFNQIYLDFAQTNPMIRARGHGVAAYTLIMEDILKSFAPSSLIANAESVSGRKFLSHLGFLPNSNPKSEECNAIFYTKLDKPFLIKLADLPKNRDMVGAPNIGAYNTLIKDAKLAGTFDEKQAKSDFYAIRSAINKNINNDILKSKVPVNPVEDFSCIDLPQTFFLNNNKDTVIKQINLLNKLQIKSDKKD